MKSNLSAFLDDELDVKEQHRVVAAMVADGDLRTAWDGYHLIRDVLHKTPCLDQDLTARVMSGIDDEEPLYTSWYAHPRIVLRSTLAVAATVAGVAAVAWIAIVPSDRPMVALAKATHATPPVAESSASRMQEYLVAHQVYSPSSSIQGGPTFVRSVSVTRAIPKQ